MDGRRPRDRALGRAARGRTGRRAARHADHADPPRARRTGRDPGRASPRRDRGARARRASSGLWSHQAEALEAAWAGPTIVTTGTASGKSLCFNLPTLDVLSRDSRARALYLYPPRRSRRTSRGRCTRSACKQRAPGDLRRRHAARPALGDPPAREPRPHQPRHAAPRDPAQPRGVGELPLQPRRRRGRRGARLPRRVRLARRQRPAPPAPGRRTRTGRSRACCWPRRRSPTPASSPSA